MTFSPNSHLEDEYGKSIARLGHHKRVQTEIQIWWTSGAPSSTTVGRNSV
jgi:hypothetical protein